MTSSVITRFAPSPTGFLHIGGGRTALFNWLYAKHTGGKCLLRIEDTDKERSTKVAVDALLDALKWMELDFEGEVVYQAQRAERHAEVAKKLVEMGKAYYCYCTPEELDEMRERQREEGKPIKYDGRWRDRSPNEAPQGVDPVVRIKAPSNDEGEMVIDDMVQGTVKVAYSQLDDMILLRSDGSPTYMLSVVVDDHDMGVTHVIRGDDHLNNAFRQTVIYEAMGWDVPKFAHIPLIHGPDGSKLSKRHGAVGLEIYRDMGYLPEAVRNYLLRLGWGHGDTDIISTEDAIKIFEIEDIGQAPSRMDFAKLDHVNAHYMRIMTEEQLLKKLMPFLEHELGGEVGEVEQERVKKGLGDLKERANTLVELAHESLFYVRSRPMILNEQAADLLNPESLSVLREIKSAFIELENFTADNIQNKIKEIAKNHGVKMGNVAMPLRAVLTGTTTSPSIFHVCENLGKDEVLDRISDKI